MGASRLSVSAATMGASLVALAGASSACAQSPREFESQHGRYRVITVASGLEHPWGLAFLPDGRMLVTERPGRLRIVGTGGALSDPLPGVPPVAARGQGGLLDVALAPDFALSAMMYLSYSEPGEGGTAGTTVARAQFSERGLNGVQVIFRQEPKVSGGAHFGSRLVFTPDGHLFITTGERGQRDMSQDLSRHQGKLIRLRPDGTVPPDNPFVGRAGARPEIWSYGHRNMQGAALHPVTGALWTVEHGAQGGDELNIPQPGRNYGWPVITYGRDYSGAPIGVGTAREGMEQPVYHWDPSIAPSGLMFYTGDRFPRWRGNLFVGALNFQLLARLELDGDRVVAEERLLYGFRQRIRDVRQGPDGYIYLLTDEDDGRVVRLEPVQP
ncbi:MAG TPA: PQQ-dependent sugar dehydrogenase [Gemmatimonadales bacterium]|nr:PQQ-dependent sugar dehydrogenase [Gemmatimonadales bacterium]